ncbi:Pol protein [Phytophthora palmivora]|uniref:Pol protein n=1 Tax=Phytophthora palmivora TaxID=4796 RepID=A0A2P4XFK5_9STRA|nr:Pol protein [Phytophthora palmivora]
MTQTNALTTINRLVAYCFYHFAISNRQTLMIFSFITVPKIARRLWICILSTSAELSRCNIDKCVFAAKQVKALSRIVTRVSVRSDAGVTKGPQKVVESIQLSSQHQDTFDSIKVSLQQVPVLALSDKTKSFSVLCGTAGYAIGRAQLQKDDDGCERVISFQSGQRKATERNYSVHDKELLVMKHTGVKLRVSLLGPRPLLIYTDHAS